MKALLAFPIFIASYAVLGTITELFGMVHESYFSPLLFILSLCIVGVSVYFLPSVKTPIWAVPVAMGISLFIVFLSASFLQHPLMYVLVAILVYFGVIAYLLS